jgi:hypothetical protein
MSRRPRTLVVRFDSAGDVLLAGPAVRAVAAGSSHTALLWVPEGTGTLSTRPEVLAAAARRYLHEPEAAAEDGARARQAALRRYGLKRFLDDWERLMTEVCS